MIFTLSSKETIIKTDIFNGFFSPIFLINLIKSKFSLNFYSKHFDCPACSADAASFYTVS